MTIDTHAHLDMAQFDADRDETVQRALDCGVTRILNPGYDVESSRQALELAERHDCIYAAAGVHPHESEKARPSAYGELCELLAHPKVIAVGETGLDYYKNFAPKDNQQTSFRRHIELALELHKPLIVHCRDAEDDVVSMLSQYYLPGHKSAGIFHCFSGGAALAEKALAMGFYISFAGPVTFKSADTLREVVKIIPPDKLFIETDSPYLAPVPHRGKRNEPAYAREIAAQVAALRGVTFEDLERVTALNFFELFGIGGAAQPGTLAYRIRDSLYLNLTQRCTNSCVFCTRLTRPVVQGYNLELEREPTADELWQAIGDPKKYSEIVFCGYGEPTLRLGVVKEVAAKIKAAGGKTRLNTNGHGNVINKRNILPELAGLIDSVSVSLNADSAEAYNAICVPMKSLRDGIYGQVKDFIREAKKCIPDVQATIVTQQSGVDENRCSATAREELDVQYRARRFNMVG